MATLTPIAQPRDLDGTSLLIRTFISSSVGSSLPMTAVRPWWLRDYDKGRSYAAAGQRSWKHNMAMVGIDDTMLERGSAWSRLDGNNYLLTQHRILSVHIIFYGPDSESNSVTIQQACWLGANTDVLSMNDLGFVDVVSASNQPEFLYNKWYPRSDLNLRFRERLVTQFGVREITSASGTYVLEGSDEFSGGFSVTK